MAEKCTKCAGTGATNGGLWVCTKCKGKGEAA
jgi:DnaJ-class molecular chaperone